MITIGLTGSIGMGKSTVAGMFADEGVPVFDADETVHRLQGPGGSLVETIEAAFPDTTGEQGVNRTALREAVFGDEAAFARLEALVHPAVARERDAFLKVNAAASMVVLDVPLLFEAGGWAAVDRIVVVSASPEHQRARVLGRPGMTVERFESILARQLSDSDKRARADFVISTDGTLEETRTQVRAVLTCLAKPAGG